jgi:hypothetical protein
MRWLRPALAVLTMMLASATAAAETGELRPALEASARFSALDGTPLTEALPGVPFRIAVRLANRLGDDLPLGLTLAGWLRPVTRGAPACSEAARAYLATGQLPTDAVSLNGPILAVAEAGGGVTVVDPKLDLASANLLGATAFAAAPAALVADPFGRRFLALFPDEGRILAIEGFGAEVRVLAEDLQRPVAVLPTAHGDLWVHEAVPGVLSRRAPDGLVEALSEGVIAVVAGADPALVATVDSDGARLWDVRRAAVRLRLAAGSRPLAAVPVGSADRAPGLAVLDADGVLWIGWEDAPDTPVSLALPAAATRLAASPDGRWIVAFDPEAAGPALLIDLARSRVHQSVAAHAPIAEVAFAGQAVFLMLADQSSVGVVDLRAAAGEIAAPVRQVALGAARRNEAAGSGPFLVPLGPIGGVLGVHADSFTAFLIEEAATMGDAPPMTAVRLRGGEPVAVAAVDRSFREIEPGVFETAAILPAAGAYELVTTTGIGALSYCASVPGSAVTVAEDDTGTIRALPTAIGDIDVVRLEFRDASGAPVAGLSVSLLVTALASPWRAHVDLVTDPDGRTAALALPALEPLAIAAKAADGRRFHPLLLE